MKTLLRQRQLNGPCLRLLLLRKPYPNRQLFQLRNLYLLHLLNMEQKTVRNTEEDADEKTADNGVKRTETVIPDSEVEATGESTVLKDTGITETIRKLIMLSPSGNRSRKLSPLPLRKSRIQ